MTTRGLDRIAQAGKHKPPEARYEVLVVGGGPAGAAAALTAAKGGAQVLLVDENPVDPGLMGLDTPLWFGGRYTSEVQTPERLTAQVFAANPLLEAAMDAGAEIALGVTCWGAWVPGWGLASLPGAVAGLADASRAWTVGFERLIAAAGARDVALAFPGWNQPGVMGARAFLSLVETYDAFAGHRIVILGSGALARRVAQTAQARGLEVAAAVEIGDESVSDLGGVRVLTGAVPIEAVGGLDGVTHLRVKADGETVDLACDTVVMAVSLTPTIELLDVLGVELAMQPQLGGHAPVSGDGVSTSLAEVFIAGDAAGVPDGVPLTLEEAEASGRRAGQAALASLGKGAFAADPRPAAGGDALARQAAWLRALNEASPADTLVCQCEEVTREALLAVRPPAYLGAPSPAQARRDITTLLADGPANQDQIKRLTRACMGPCQARRCREQVALNLAFASNEPPERTPLAGYRAPVRPLPLKVIAAWDEAPAMDRYWDVWMGVASQWILYQDIGTEREAISAGIFANEQ
jgi:thioredoxin reductase